MPKKKTQVVVRERWRLFCKQYTLKEFSQTTDKIQIKKPVRRIVLSFFFKYEVAFSANKIAIQKVNVLFLKLLREPVDQEKT